MTTDSLFQGCSTTKAFAAAAAALVIDDEKSKPDGSQLRWDTPISSVIPDDFVLADPFATANTTFEDALSHRSGLPEHFLRLQLARSDEKTRDLVRSLRYLPLAFAPRTNWKYNNFMYMAVSHALEQRTGEALGSFMKRRIWEPLEMRDTYFDVQEVQKTPGIKDRLVQAYDWFDEIGKYRTQPNLNYEPTKGAGAIVSNALDYAKWVKALLNKSTPLSKEGHEAIFRPRSIISSEAFDTTNTPLGWAHLYALGWFIDSYQGHQYFWHTGGWAGTAVLVGLIPSKNFGFTMMSNSSAGGAPMQQSLYPHLLEKYLNLPISENLDNSQAKPKETETPENAILRLFKSLSLDHPIPLPVPLSSLTGTYIHPAYGSLTFELKEGTLRADCMDRVLESTIDLDHVTASHFLAKFYLPGWGKEPAEYYAAEFHIAPNGQADRLGMRLEPALGEVKIWFDRSTAFA
jgi:CubicO group peptidase (beta-lactamase class C family)